MGRAEWIKLFSKPIPLVFSLFLLVITILPKLTSLLIVVLLLLWLFEGGWKARISFYKKNPAVFILPIFFLLHLVSLSYSENIDIGWKKMETLLSMLIFPLMVPTFKKLDYEEQKETYRWAFIIGILINLVLCLSRSTALFSYEMYARYHRIELEVYPYTNYFFYSYLSYFMHYGYLAMYVNVAIAFLLKVVSKRESSSKLKRNAYILLVLFSIFVLLLNSKAGILALLILYLYFAIFQLLKNGNTKSAVLSISTVVLLGIALYQFVPHTKERVQGMINGITNTEVDPTSHESTQLRIFAWRSSMDLIQKEWQLGYGLGDANIVLLEDYEKKGYIGALEEDLNAHNQFFQSMLNVGILGTVLLLFFFVYLYFIGIKSLSFELQVFALITFLAFLAEAYLQTQKGVLYTVVLSTLLLTDYFGERFKDDLKVE